MQEKYINTFPFQENAFLADTQRMFSRLKYLSIGLPKNGSLYSGSVEFLNRLNWSDNINITAIKNARKLHTANEHGGVLSLLRQDDIILSLKQGSVDVGILGADKILEDQLSNSDDKLVPLHFLGFGSCNFCIGFPIDREIPTNYSQIKKILENGSVATSLPNVLIYLLGKNGIELSREQILSMSGSVEIAPKIFPEIVAVADIVESGETAMVNGIRPDLDLITFPGAFLSTTISKLEQVQNG